MTKLDAMLTHARARAWEQRKQLIWQMVGRMQADPRTTHLDEWEMRRVAAQAWEQAHRGNTVLA